MIRIVAPEHDSFQGSAFDRMQTLNRRATAKSEACGPKILFDRGWNDWAE
jgi:hypothetical protein